MHDKEKQKMIIQLTSYTLPEVSAKVVLLNWINHSNEDEYKERLRGCEIPVLDYQDQWRDYNIPSHKHTILCLENLADPMLQKFKNTYERLCEAYDRKDRVSVLQVLMSLYAKNIDIESIRASLKKHDELAFRNYCIEEKMTVDMDKFEEWYRGQQEMRSDLKEEEDEDALSGI